MADRRSRSGGPRSRGISLPGLGPRASRSGWSRGALTRRARLLGTALLLLLMGILLYLDRMLAVLFAAVGRFSHVLLALESFAKTTQKTPPARIDIADERLRDWVQRGRERAKKHQG